MFYCPRCEQQNLPAMMQCTFRPCGCVCCLHCVLDRSLDQKRVEIFECWCGKAINTYTTTHPHRSDRLAQKKTRTRSSQVHDQDQQLTSVDKHFSLDADGKLTTKRQTTIAHDCKTDLEMPHGCPLIRPLERGLRNIMANLHVPLVKRATTDDRNAAPLKPMELVEKIAQEQPLLQGCLLALATGLRLPVRDTEDAYSRSLLCFVHL